MDDLLIPLHIIPSQRRGVPLDQRDRRFQFMRNRRDKDVLHFLRLPEISDVTHIGNNVAQPSLSRQQRRIDDAEAHRQPIRANQVTFDVKCVRRVWVVITGVARPAIVQRLLERQTILPLEDKYSVVVLPAGISSAPARHPFQRVVDAQNPRLTVKDHHTISAVLQNRRQPPPFMVDTFVKLCIVHRNRCLVREALKHLHVIRRGIRSIRAKHDQQTKRLTRENQRKRERLLESLVQRNGDFAEFRVQRIVVERFPFSIEDLL